MASSQQLVSPSKGVPPLFTKVSTLAKPPGSFVNGLDICYALESVSGKDTVDCVQRMGDLFRIYPKTRPARDELLTKGFIYNGIFVSLLSKNPYQVRDEEVNSTKLLIDGVPMSVADSEIEKALLDLDLKLLSDIKYETYRDSNGKWTHFKTGRRFVYVQIPKLNLKPFLQIGLWRASIYYKEQIRPKRNSGQEAPIEEQSKQPDTENIDDPKPDNGREAATPSTEFVVTDNLAKPAKGKPTFSFLASRTDTTLWSEAKGEGVTVEVKKTAGKAGNERRARSPTRHRNRRGNLRDHWSPFGNRSTSSKRKVSEQELFCKSKQKQRRTFDTTVSLDCSISPSQHSAETSDLC